MMTHGSGGVGDEAASPDDLVTHVESFLGPIDVGWTKDADGEPMPFQVARFTELETGWVAFMTIGLSAHRLRSRVSEKTIRQELLILVPPTHRDGPLPGILQQVGNMALDSHHALLRGDVVGPYGKLLDGTDMEALYVAPPTIFPDDFAVYEGSAGDVVIAWLIPIHHSEAHFVHRNGWSKFENRLLAADPDLLDVRRGPVA
jgi:hypothetical protein